jgi:methyl-accepting chemotaxis protein
MGSVKKVLRFFSSLSDRISIKLKLIIVFAIVLVGLLGLTLFSYASLDKLNAEMSNVYEVDLAAMNVTQQLKTDLVDYNQRTIMATRTNRGQLGNFVKDMQKLKATISEHIEEVKKIDLDEDKRILIENLEFSWQKVLDKSTDLEREISNNNGSRVLDIFTGNVREVNSAMTNAEAIYGIKYREVIASKALIQETKESAVVTNLTILGIVLILTGLGGWILYQSIVTRLKTLAILNTSIADGNLTMDKMEVTNDEIGVLAKSANYIMDNLKVMILEVRNSVQTMSNNVASVTQAIDENYSTTESIAANVEEMSKGVAEQAAHSEKSLVHISELDTSVKEILHIIDDFKDSLANTFSKIESGSGELQETSEQIKQVEESNKLMIESFDSLSKELVQIREYSEEIVGISKSTNILSLNASIEAARAGELGKGFAVVANEIRKLSAETTRVANGVKEVVVRNEEKTNEFKETLELSNQRVTSGTATFQSAYNMFQEINHMIESMNKQMIVVMESANHIKSQSELVTNNMSDISAISEETSAAIQEIAASTSQQVNNLKGVVDSVKEQSKLSSKVDENMNRFKLD